MKQITLNKEMYPLDVVFSAAYSLMDIAYFLFDEDQQKNIVVNIQPKGHDILEIENKFKESLLNYLVYSKQLKATQPIREDILRRALLLAIPSENKPT